jgi:hypothetical protein
MIRVVRIKPMPPCCIAWLVMPSVKSDPINDPAAAVVQKATTTRATISSAIETIALNTAIVNLVPMLYAG